MEAQHNYQVYLNLALELAKESGKVIKEAFYTSKVIEHKGLTDLVTDTDKKVESFIIGSIKTAYPTHQVLAEESFDGEFYNLTDAPTWIIDPVDGTTNFVHRYPFVAVCIGLAINKIPVVGVVFNPIINELYHAVKGQGAFLNGERIHVSDVKRIDQSVIATNIGYDRTVEGIDFITGNVKNLMAENVRSIRAGGTSAVDMCSVACGRLDAYYEVGIHPWDIAAAGLIVEEAGGIALDPTGKPLDLENRRILAGNKEITKLIADVLNKLPIPEKWHKYDKRH